MVTLQVVPLILDKAGLCLRITPCRYINFITRYLLINLYKIKHPSTHWLSHPVPFYICWVWGRMGLQSSPLIGNHNWLDPTGLISAMNKPLNSPEGIKKGVHSVIGLSSALQRKWKKSCDFNKIHPVVQGCHVSVFHQKSDRDVKHTLDFACCAQMLQWDRRAMWSCAGEWSKEEHSMWHDHRPSR